MAESEQCEDKFITGSSLARVQNVQLENSVKLLSIEEPLVSDSEEFSLVSYNVLLNAWWMYKNYYQPLQIPEEKSSWEWRKKLHIQFASKSLPDVYCLQECSPESFYDDFGFLKDFGYDFIFQEKGNKYMRCATFFKKTKFECASSASGNRAIVGDFIHKDTGQHVYIINCHLAGGSGLELMQQRIRGIVEYTKILKNKLKAPKDAKVVLCGDFNSSNEPAVNEILATGVLDKTYLSDGVQVTRKTKRIAQGWTFIDAYAKAYGEQGPPPTFIAPNHIKKMVAADGDLNDAVKEKLEKIFKKFSSDGCIWSPEDAKKWVRLVNGGLLRGTEWRVVSEAIEKKGHVELEDYIGAIRALLGGLFWEIDYELYICEEYLEQEKERMYESRFDYIFHTGTNLQVTGVRQVATEKNLELYRAERPLPNELEPSDHLPIGVVFRIGKN